MLSHVRFDSKHRHKAPRTQGQKQEAMLSIVAKRLAAVVAAAAVAAAAVAAAPRTWQHAAYGNLTRSAYGSEDVT